MAQMMSFGKAFDLVPCARLGRRWLSLKPLAPSSVSLPSTSGMRPKSAWQLCHRETTRKCNFAPALESFPWENSSARLTEPSPCRANPHRLAAFTLAVAGCKKFALICNIAILLKGLFDIAILNGVKVSRWALKHVALVVLSFCSQ